MKNILLTSTGFENKNIENKCPRIGTVSLHIPVTLKKIYKTHF